MSDLIRCTKQAYHEWHPVRHWLRLHRVCVQCGMKVRL